MKNQILFSLISILTIGTSHAATIPWWEQPTVCRLDPTDCYRGMGTGFEPEMWDTTSQCWGLKLICPAALTANVSDAQPMEMRDISRNNGINTDFDTDMLSDTGDCFGRRKTADGGAMASANGKYVHVFCPGILENPDEVLDNGEIIVRGSQPTCSTLARDGYAAVENGRCYGKYYNSAQYFIECGTSLAPTRLIVLNGADYTAPSSGAPTTMDAATEIFDDMYSTSQTQRKKYFE